MLFVVETKNLRRLLNINKRIKVMTRWLMKTNILAQFSLIIECLEWFRSIMWAKRMHTKSTNKFQYFVFKMTMRRLDDEKAERDFYFSEDFSFIHIVYSNFRMSRLKSMTQRVWNIIIIISVIIEHFCNKFDNSESVRNLLRANLVISIDIILIFKLLPQYSGWLCRHWSFSYAWLIWFELISKLAHILVV
jgi:hypothetical protein